MIQIVVRSLLDTYVGWSSLAIILRLVVPGQADRGRWVMIRHEGLASETMNPVPLPRLHASQSAL